MSKIPNTRTPIKTIINILKIIGGTILTPILFSLFTLDRFILVFLPHIQPETIQECFKNIHKFESILYRTGAFGFVILTNYCWGLLF